MRESREGEAKGSARSSGGSSSDELESNLSSKQAQMSDVDMSG